MNGTLHVVEQEHECSPPGWGWHRTFYYKPNGEGAHIQCGDQWECECGRWWIAGKNRFGEHQWHKLGWIKRWLSKRRVTAAMKGQDGWQNG